MSKVINFEIVDIDEIEKVVSVESESGFTTDLDLTELPDNIKVGQTLKCIISLSAVSQKERKRKPYNLYTYEAGKRLPY